MNIHHLLNIKPSPAAAQGRDPRPPLPARRVPQLPGREVGRQQVGAGGQPVEAEAVSIGAQLSPQLYQPDIRTSLRFVVLCRLIVQCSEA